MWIEERKLLKDWLQWEIQDEDLKRPLEQIEEWVSFSIIQFMTEMEDNYSINVTLGDLDYIQTVEDLLEYMSVRRKR